MKVHEYVSIIPLVYHYYTRFNYQRVSSTGCLPHLIEKAVTKAQHRCEEHVTWDETRPLGPLGPLGPLVWMARKVIIYIYI